MTDQMNKFTRRMALAAVVIACTALVGGIVRVRMHPMYHHAFTGMTEAAVRDLMGAPTIDSRKESSLRPGPGDAWCYICVWGDGFGGRLALYFNDQTVVIEECRSSR